MAGGLIETHTFLWFAHDDPRLSNNAAKTIHNKKAQNFLSIVSVWEIAIKMGIGKLKISDPLEEFVAKYTQPFAIEILPIEIKHTAIASTLPFPHHNHKDPYDRLLISQCLALSIPIIGVDEKFDAYGILRIW